MHAAGRSVWRSTSWRCWSSLPTPTARRSASTAPWGSSISSVTAPWSVARPPGPDPGRPRPPRRRAAHWSRSATPFRRRSSRPCSPTRSLPVPAGGPRGTRWPRPPRRDVARPDPTANHDPESGPRGLHERGQGVEVLHGRDRRHRGEDAITPRSTSRSTRSAGCDGSRPAARAVSKALWNTIGQGPQASTRRARTGSSRSPDGVSAPRVKPSRSVVSQRGSDGRDVRDHHLDLGGREHEVAAPRAHQHLQSPNGPASAAA